ncbi:hypothetical protein B0I35DRAFT_498337 [Stachybotrys elegans]|uniref:WSC domain-containing protein n=1 Tax=Stachybotrys elegans TaxID=80388 RepID=A0A8K0WKL1_9HYPO|nr:hypothetical protein B0I35DRAFT_498337 [Stachybotrys elegans]
MAVGEGNTCWFGDEMSANLSQGDECHLRCSGNSTEICGGRNGVVLYEDYGFFASYVPPPTITTTRDVSASASSTTAGIPTSTEQTVAYLTTTYATLETSTAITTTDSGGNAIRLTGYPIHTHRSTAILPARRPAAPRAARNATSPYHDSRSYLEWEGGGDESESDARGDGGGHLTKRNRRPQNIAVVGGLYGRLYGNRQTPVDLCPDHLFAWRSPSYPSTSQSTPDVDGDGEQEEMEALPSSVPEYPGLGEMTRNTNFFQLGHVPHGKYIDVLHSLLGCPMQVGPCSSPTTCGLGRQDAGTLRAYNTEHVFEIHQVKDFFWLTQNERCTSCNALRRNFVDFGYESVNDPALMPIPPIMGTGGTTDC